MGTRLFGYKISSASSGQTCDSTLDVGVFPISGGNQRGIPGAIAVCMYAWDPESSKWIPYVAAA